MKKQLKLCGLSLLVLSQTGCVVLPQKAANAQPRCELSTDQKTLRIVDIAAETDTYYSVTGILLSPILIPATALLSGTYVAVNNTYHLGEEKLVCAAPQQTAQDSKPLR